MAARLRMFANGATAMRELAGADDGAIGCTQATEIRYTPGLALVGALPPPFALATVYGAAIGRGARDEDARAPAHRPARRRRRAPLCAAPAASTTSPPAATPSSSARSGRRC